MVVTIKVEILAGTSIEDAFKETISLSKKLECYVDFDFNGVQCTSRPNGSVSNGTSNYHDAISGKKLFKHANS